MKWKFKEEKSFEERSKEALKVKAKFPNRIPVPYFRISFFRIKVKL